MEMANYIFNIIKAQTIIMWSWGIHQIVAIENGLQFRVNGWKFQGKVKVIYDEGLDLFNITFIQRGKVVKTMEGIYADMLTNTIDEFVEKLPSYKV